MTVTEFIEARLAETLRAAMAASSHPGYPATEAEHWRWECTEDDAPLDLYADVETSALGDGPVLFHCGDWRTGLRSTEEYPEDGAVSPHLVLDTIEPVRPEDARHIILNDPNRAARMVTGIRGLMEVVTQLQLALMITESGAELLLGPVAAIWDDHPGFQAKWSQ